MLLTFPNFLQKLTFERKIYSIFIWLGMLQAYPGAPYPGETLDLSLHIDSESQSGSDC